MESHSNGCCCWCWCSQCKGAHNRSNRHSPSLFAWNRRRSIVECSKFKAIKSSSLAMMDTVTSVYRDQCSLFCFCFFLKTGTITIHLAENNSSWFQRELFLLIKMIFIERIYPWQLWSITESCRSTHPVIHLSWHMCVGALASDTNDGVWSLSKQ